MAAPTDISGASSAPRMRPWWPIAPLLLLVPTVVSLFVDTYDTSAVLTVGYGFVPVALAIAVAGLAIGGAGGGWTAATLTLLAAYWAWWFGWGADGSIAPFSIGDAADGLVGGSVYLVGLVILLWPFVLAAAFVTAVIARERHHRVWPALGLLGLAIVVLAFPTGASWDDGCNTHSGSTPLITKPFTTWLMVRGVGVIPDGGTTLMACLDVPGGDWKPLWLGDDHLPPGPTLHTTFIDGPYQYLRIPEHLAD